ncbi:MAG TPA: tetratricopeptide repeat protein, partial [Planctomycetaceae bacterium]|nr:tetratricopeptide repeat protein [Planctomycetaceae bacterium]
LYVTEEAHIRNGMSAKDLAWAFGTFYDCNWIPLTWVSLMLDATLYGTWPGGHHLVNVLLHAANVLLIFAVLLKATRKTGQSAFVAALFAVHPLHVESVAWIAERKDVLSLFFGLAALYAYVGYAQKPGRARLALSIVCYLCSLLSKQTLVTLPFVLLLLDSWPLRRGGPIVPRLLEKIPYFALSAAFCVIELVAQVRGHSARTLTEFPLWSRCANAVLVYALYLKKALLPFDLAVFYPHPGREIPLLAAAAALVVLALVTWFAVAHARRWPFLLVGWLWYLGTLVPMIGVVQVGIQQMADRYTYFPMLGIYIAVAWLVPALVEKTFVGRRDVSARTVSIMAGGVVCLYAAIAFVQVGYWRDGVTLMRRSLALTDDSAFARVLLGDALYVQSRTEEALGEFEHAVRLSPHDPENYFRLGWVLQDLKRYDEAADQFRASLAVDEKISSTHNRLGWILWWQHQYADAAREFDRAIELDETNVGAYLNRAGLSRALGNFRRSIADCQRGLAASPRSTDCRRLIAFNLRDLGQLDEAVHQLQNVLTLDPEDSEARGELAHIQSMIAERPNLTGRAN